MGREPGARTAYRDPKVFWHEPTKKWIMVLCGPPDYSYLIFTSADLLHWEKQSSIPDMFECPDMFPLGLDGDAAKIKWVVVNGDAKYLVGDFDGKVFTPAPRRRRATGAVRSTRRRPSTTCRRTIRGGSNLPGCAAGGGPKCPSTSSGASLWN